MRALVSILLVMCFVSVAALASYEKAEAAYPVDISAESVEQSSDRPAIPTGHGAADFEAAGKNDDCLCEENSDSLTLTCGVTLALSGVNANGRLIVTDRARFAFENTDRDARMMYLLRRPPRYRL